MPIVLRLYNLPKGIKFNWHNFINISILNDILINTCNMELNELLNLKYIIDSKLMDDNIDYPVPTDDDLLIIIFSTETSILLKLINIFDKFNINSDNKNNNVSGPIDEKENEISKDTELAIDKNIIDTINNKTLKLFQDDDFKQILKIYMNRPEIFKTLLEYIQTGDFNFDISKLNKSLDQMSESEIENYNLLTDQIMNLNLNISRDIIFNKLLKYSGHLNFVLRDLIK